ncbi:MAG: rod shape-determining protein MreD [Firmicutes bacterium]|nr:rod shape-determining protein MreD [Bacillota bacterium]
MRKWPFVVVAASWLCQAAVVAVVSPRGAVPDIPLLASQFAALLTDPLTGGLAGLIAGLQQDLLASRYIGLNALSKAACGLIAGLAGRRVYCDRFAVPFSVGFVATLLCNTLAFIILRLAGAGVSLFDRMPVIAMASLYNALLGPVVFAAIGGVRAARSVLRRQV